MKRLLFALVLAFVYSLNSSAQFVHYEPVRTGRVVETETVSAYLSTRDGLKKVQIKIAYTEDGGCYVCAYYKKQDYGNPFVTYTPVGGSKWTNTNASIYQVGRNDGQYLYDNFDYKANINGLGTVYF